MRAIKKSEFDFMCLLEEKSGVDLKSIGLSHWATVKQLDDGGMGSIEFEGKVSHENRQMQEAVIEGSFHDADGEFVSFAVNVDNLGQLFELDLWRVDFNPLIQLPTLYDSIEIRIPEGT